MPPVLIVSKEHLINCTVKYTVLSNNYMDYAMKTNVFIAFFFILFSVALFSQDVAKNSVKLDGVSVGMTMDEVYKAMEAPFTPGANDKIWIFFDNNLTVEFDDKDLVSDVTTENPGSVLEFNGKTIENGSDVKKALEILGKPDHINKTEMVTEYTYQNLGILLLTYADDDTLVLISIFKL